MNNPENNSNQNFLMEIINRMDYPKKYRKSLMLFIITLVITVALFVAMGMTWSKSPGSVVGVAMVIGVVIGATLIICFLFLTLSFSRKAKKLEKTHLYKKLNKEFRFRSKEDFFKLDEAVTRDIKENTVYGGQASKEWGRIIVTKNYILLDMPHYVTAVIERAKALLVTGYTYSAQTRHSNTVVYQIRIFTSDRVYDVNVPSNLVQQEEGMNIANAARILFAPQDAGFYNLYKRNRNQFMADATRETKILYDGIAERSQLSL